MFPWNDELHQHYAATHPESKETLVDFGQIPEDLEERADWSAEVSRLIRTLTARGYQFQVAMDDGFSGPCPLYAVRLDKGDFNGLTPVDPSHLEWVVTQICFPGQTTERRDHVLGIRVLPDGDLGSVLAGNR